MWEKYKHLFIIFGCVFIFAMGLLLMGESGFINNRINPQSEIMEIFDGQNASISNEIEVIEKKIYECGQTETKQTYKKNTTFEQLIVENYQEKEGWEGQITNESQIVFTKKSDDLCSEHKKFRHISKVDDKVAIMYGPLGADAGIAHFTDIPVSVLPEHIQKQLDTKSMEFSNEQKAFQALDSLEEYNN